ncbi:MAG: cytochrome C [Nitrospirae bacterium]|nr:cytochrome C [Nitrospirota bacterium]
MKKNIVVVIIISSILIMHSLAAAEDITYSSHIKKIFDSKCTACHGSDTPEHAEFKKDKEKYKALSKGMRMDTYPHLIQYIGWPDTGAVMRRLDDGKNTVNGKPGNMYEYLGSDENERQANLNLFKKWIGNWTLKRWNDAKKEDIEGMHVKY